MNDCRCYFHPREFVIGICALCLNEKLLVLAAKQGTIHYHHTQKKVITKIFALASLFGYLEIKRQKADDDQYWLSSSTSPEESFISIKFEGNGVALWDKGKISKTPFDQRCKTMPWKEDANEDENMIKSVVEHAKPRAVLRWRRRIGHLFKLVRLKKSTKGTMCHVSTKPNRSKS